MRIYNEEDLLDQAYRKKLIEEIEDSENTGRKSESFKRYEIYRDRIKKYILENLLKELDQETVDEMQSRVATVNMYKKMVQKKARVYKDIPIRTSVLEDDQDYIDSLADLLNLNTTMKKVNRYVEAFRNCAVYVKPYIDHSKDGKWSYMLDVLAPHQFDVIEDMDNPQMVRAVILSNYRSDAQTYGYYNEHSRTATGVVNRFRDGDYKMQNIADSPADKPKEYVFWSKNYHFTCDCKGNIIDRPNEEGINNPIMRLPFVFFSKDQDDSFWSVGGEDIIEGSILINTLLTDLYFIAKIQGSGLFYMFGKNVPSTYKVGPNRAVTMEVEEGDPTPQIGFASSNPPIGDHMQMVEQYVAFLLSTNDLGVNSIQGKLDAATAASGIQEIIQNSEPMTAIEDEQEQYRDKEPEILQIANAWQSEFMDSQTGLTSAFSDIGYSEDLIYAIKFDKPKHFSSELERLDAVNKKIEQGIYNKVDAMIDENPDLTREEALEQLLKRAEESLKLMQSGMEAFIRENNGNTSDEEAEPEQPGFGRNTERPAEE